MALGGVIAVVMVGLAWSSFGTLGFVQRMSNEADEAALRTQSVHEQQPPIDVPESPVDPPPAGSAMDGFSVPSDVGAVTEKRGKVSSVAGGDSDERGVRSALFPNGAANQAPPLSQVPFFARSWKSTRIGAGGAPDSDDRVQVEVPLTATAMPPALSAVCWGRSGDPVPVPSFVVGMFSQIPSAGHYAALANVSDANPWAVLLAWVPSRFMPPQPDGKNAAGQIIKAPTRGRDPKFYRREYNATWHANAEVKGGLSYEFLLAHRNALAVCIRERLHINAIRCAPSTSSPVALLHHCVCRKCAESTAHPTPKAVGKMPGFVATAPHRPLLLSKALVDSTPFLQQKPRVIAGMSKRGGAAAAPKAPYSGKCVQALSAPWLVGP